eukprot:12924243-Prorocentrum_lima.AAC.1
MGRSGDPTGWQVGHIGRSTDRPILQVSRFERSANVGRWAGSRSHRQIGRLADPRDWQVREIG